MTPPKNITPTKKGLRTKMWVGERSQLVLHFEIKSRKKVGFTCVPLILKIAIFAAHIWFTFLRNLHTFQGALVAKSLNAYP